MTEVFEPVIKGASSYKSDGVNHSRQWSNLARYLESDFVGAAQISDGAVGDAQLADGSIHDAKIFDVSVSKLTDGTFNAVGTMAGAWVADKVRFDATGIVQTNEDGASVLVRLSADGSLPFFRGQVEALGLLVENDFVLRGANNLMEAGSTIRMGGAATGQSVGNPGAAPGLAVQRDTFEMDSLPFGRQPNGIFYDATNTSWWVAFQGERTAGPSIDEYDNDAPKTLLRSLEIAGADKIYGVCRLNTRVYVLVRKTGDQKTWIRTYSQSSLSFLGERRVADVVPGGTLRGQPAFGTNGTTVFVVDLNGSGNVRFHEFTESDIPVFSSTTVSSGTGNPDFEPDGSTLLTDFASAESGWWVSVMPTSRTGGQSGLFRVHKWNTSGVYQQNTFFENGENLRGIAHDGSVFYTLGDEHVIVHTNWTWTTESAKYWIAYTYVDDNGSASVGARPLGAGDFETTKSPSASVTMPKRAKLRCSAAAVDTTLTGITHVGWYIERGATEPTLDYQADSVVTDGVATVRVVSDFTTDASPEAPPGSNTFPDSGSANYATFESSSGVPILRADGVPRCKAEYTAGGNVADVTSTYVRMGNEVKDTDGFHPSTTDALNATPDSTYNFTLPFAGQYLIVAYADWATNATGRRRILLDLNGSEYERANQLAVGGEATRHVASFVVDAAASDTLRFAVLQASGGALALNKFKASIVFLGPA